nr:hypothetical protein [Lachnospiraceae bacterium]
MKTERVALSLDNFEQRLMVNGLMNFRNGLLSDARPTEDVEELILKVIDAPPEKKSRRKDRGAR